LHSGKRTKLSKRQKQFIRKHHEQMPITQMADRLKIRPTDVERNGPLCDRPQLANRLSDCTLGPDAREALTAVLSRAQLGVDEAYHYTIECRSIKALRVLQAFQRVDQ
jgi:hypothetical protein